MTTTLRLTSLPECPRCKATNNPLVGSDATAEVTCCACSRPFFYTRFIRFSSTAIDDAGQMPDAGDFECDRIEDRPIPEEAQEVLKEMDKRGVTGKDGWRVMYDLWPDVQAWRQAGTHNFNIVGNFSAFRIYHPKVIAPESDPPYKRIHC